MPKQPAVYIMASQRHGTLYVGVTSDLEARVWQHRTGAMDGLTKDYGVKAPVYFELHASMSAALAREKQIKRWNRARKIELIEKTNPTWDDLWPEISGDQI